MTSALLTPTPGEFQDPDTRGPQRCRCTQQAVRCHRAGHAEGSQGLPSCRCGFPGLPRAKWDPKASLARGVGMLMNEGWAIELTD